VSSLVRADVLMITHERTDYVRRSLPRLLDTCPEDSRVWVWHNGTHEPTLEVVRAQLGHPRLHRFHHSRENTGLREATNWLWREADADYLGKVDDDSLMEPGWIERLSQAHGSWPGLGVLGAWRFMDEDFRPDLARRKFQHRGDVTVLRNLWVQGSGYLVPKPVVDAVGPLRDGESFYWWNLRVTRAGYLNGFLFPFVREEHLDDPRHPATMFVDDESFMAHRPLSARTTGVTTLAGWLELTRRDAVDVQRAPLALSAHVGWRRATRRIRWRVRRALTGRATW
jgi:glycosyltransferase involved in cell wall biosynthesis